MWSALNGWSWIFKYFLYKEVGQKIGILDLCILQFFTILNKVVHIMNENRRDNTEAKWKMDIRLNFYSIIAGDLMPYVDASADNETVDKNIILLIV